MKVNPFKIPIGVVAHIDRKDIALSLVEEVGAECISIDDQNRGAGWNHVQVLEYLHDSPTEWVVVLEDDCVPVGNFRRQLEEALNWAPTPFVGLYMGRGRPPHWQAGISEVIAKESCWLVCDTMMNAVGYAVKTKIVPIMLESLEDIWEESGAKLPIDQAITRFGQDYKIPFCYTRPSLVNHLDITPVEQHCYGTPTEKRVAWLFGERQSWNGSTTSLEYVKSW